MHPSGLNFERVKPLYPIDLDFEQVKAELIMHDASISKHLWKMNYVSKTFLKTTFYHFILYFYMN